MSEEDIEPVIEDGIDASVIDITSMDEAERNRVLLYLNGYVNGYQKCWSDVLKSIAPHISEELFLILSHISAGAKLDLNTRLNTIKEGLGISTGISQEEDVRPEDPAEIPSDVESDKGDDNDDV
jgi:hypothetical protein